MRNQQLPLPALEPGGNAPGTVARTGGRNRRNGGRKRWEKSCTDINRVICYDEGSNIGYYSGRATKIIDEMYPITMPYVPSTKPYKVYVREHSLEPGTFDGVEFLYMITPDGERIELNSYFAELDGEHMVEVSKEEYINFINKDNK